MKSASIGTSTSGPEVTDISPFGVWILYRAKEYFLSFSEFPWFQNASVQSVFNVREDGPEHLRWPDLDVDLSLNSIKCPSDFPKVYEASGTYRQSTPSAE